MIIAGQIGQPCLKSSAIRTPAKPSIEATDRSISPVTTSKVSGSAMIAISPTLRQMKNRFVDCRKYGETAAPYAIVPPRRTRRSVSQRATKPVPRHAVGRRLGTSSPGLRSSSSATGSPPRAQGGRNAQRDQPVEGDRGDEQRARDSLAPEGRHVHNDERAVDRVEEECTEGGAEDGAAAAEDGHAADDDRGNHLELVADAGDRVNGAEARQPDGAGDPGDAAAQHEGKENARADGDAREARRGRIRPDRVEVARRAERTHGVRRDRDSDDSDDAEVRDPQHGAVADLVEALRQHGGVDLVAAGPGAVDPADDVERPERDDEARHAGNRHDGAVDDPARHADTEG